MQSFPRLTYNSPVVVKATTKTDKQLAFCVIFPYKEMSKKLINKKDDE